MSDHVDPVSQSIDTRLPVSDHLDPVTVNRTRLPESDLLGPVTQSIDRVFLHLII